MQKQSHPLRVALVAIARPTFDVPLAQSVADHVVAALEAAGIAVVGSRNELLMDGGAAQRAIALLTQDSFDLLLCLQASFADSSMIVEIAEALRTRNVPLLLWAVPDIRDGGRLRLNSFCGINLAAHALHLRSLPYDYLLTTADDSAAMAKIGVWARAGRAVQTLQRARIGLIGEHPVGFDTCAFDAEQLYTRLGLTVVSTPLASLLQQAAAVDLPTRQQIAARIAERVNNLADLDQSAVGGTAGVYAALHALAQREDLAGLAVRCWPEFFTELHCAACGAMSLLNNELCPASCEADVNGTVTSLLLQALSGEPAFITDLVSLEAESDSGVFWHCGLAPFQMADPTAEVAGTVHSNRKLPLLFEFPLKPGRVTIARLHHVAATAATAPYQLVVGGGEMVRAPKSFGGTSGVIRFDQPATAVLETIMRHGLEHHFSIIYGDFRNELRAFAQQIGLPILMLC
ncbi:MAG: hypothetical protein KDE19_24925 [Caldilineaceae bacterium]|nr:hypothetical protein [Caldilineaceae bacterium]